MTTPTPTGLRPVTLHLTDPRNDEPLGSCAIRLVLTTPGQSTDSGAYAITHALGTVYGGTHTEVVFADGTLGARDLTGDGSFTDPERDRLADEVVRQIANTLYGRSWAFHYRPDRVPSAVLSHGSVLRERIEVSEVELWNAR